MATGTAAGLLVHMLVYIAVLAVALGGAAANDPVAPAELPLTLEGLRLKTTDVAAALPSEHQLSNQTREWWRWVLVRVTGFVEFVNTDDDREEFVREWNPDLFEWAGDYRMNVNEWARLHGIAMAAGQELEYEEAQFWYNAAKPNIVNTTWGSDGLNSRRRDCHFADIPSPSLLKRLLKGEGGAAE